MGFPADLLGKWPSPQAEGESNKDDQPQSTQRAQEVVVFLCALGGFYLARILM